MFNQIRQFFEQSWLPFAGLAVAVAVMIWAVVRIRTYFREEPDTAGGCEFLLSDLREMKQKGDLSEEEFRKLKSQFNKRDNDPGAIVPSEPADPADGGA